MAKVYVPKDAVTPEMCKSVFSKNSNDVIVDSVDERVIESFCELLGLPTSSVLENVRNLRNYFAMPSSLNFAINDTETQIDSNEIEGVTVSLYSSDSTLSLLVEVNGTAIHKASKRMRSAAIRDYVLEDIGSGTSSDGTRYLAIAVYEETDDDMPYSMNLAFEIKADNTVVEHTNSGSEWDDNELGSFLMYDKQTERFTMFKPHI